MPEETTSGFGKARPPVRTGRGLVTVGFDDVEVEVEINDIAGVPEIVSVSVRPNRRRGYGPGLSLPVPITSDLIRRIPLRQLKENAIRVLEGGELRLDAFEDVPSRIGGGPLSTEFLERIADIYEAAVDHGVSPLGEIQKAQGVTKAGASKYVRRAREAGVLGYPARPGMPGSTEKTSPIKKRAAKKTIKKAAKASKAGRGSARRTR